jgi:hypothetical protein
VKRQPSTPKRSAKAKRSLFRWLTAELGMCKSSSKPFAGLTPAEAWVKASPMERFRVMDAVGIRHIERSCPYCTDGARANKAIPVKVLRSFRNWQEDA